jgi:hypothetical protein
VETACYCVQASVTLAARKEHAGLASAQIISLADIFAPGKYRPKILLWRQAVCGTLNQAHCQTRTGTGLRCQSQTGVYNKNPTKSEARASLFKYIKTKKV